MSFFSFASFFSAYGLSCAQNVPRVHRLIFLWVGATINFFYRVPTKDAAKRSTETKKEKRRDNHVVGGGGGRGGGKGRGGGGEEKKKRNKKKGGG